MIRDEGENKRGRGELENEEKGGRGGICQGNNEVKICSVPSGVNPNQKCN